MNTRLTLIATFLLAALLSVPATTYAQVVLEDSVELVSPAQPTSTGASQVEVVDVFWFGCPHCYRFLPVMERYIRNKADYVTVIRMPAVLRKSWSVHARAFYVAAHLGVGERIHRPLFEAIHEHKRRLATPSKLRQFFAENAGVPSDDFNSAWNNPRIDAQLARAKQLQQAYGVSGTPTVIINGKFRTSGKLAGGFANVITVIERLAAREAAILEASN
jgi:protein dithiol oxidoreductase (disulfide-forming)